MRAGIKEGYPRLRRFAPEKVVAFIKLLRPFTLLPPVLAGVFGTLLPVAGSWTWLHLREAIYVGATLALLQAVGQIVNQVCDAEIDRLAKPYRPIPRGEVSPEEAMGIAWMLAIFAVGRGFMTGFTFGMFCLLLLFFAVGYNILPFRVKRYTWPSVLWVAASRGFVPFLATWSVFGSLSDPLPWLLGGLAFLWALALNPTKDFPDAEVDAKFGVMTLPVRYGEELATGIMVGLVGIWLLYLVALVEALPKLLPLALIVPLAGVAVFGLKVTTPLENNLSWQAFYAGLGLHYVLAYAALC